MAANAASNAACQLPGCGSLQLQGRDKHAAPSTLYDAARKGQCDAGSGAGGEVDKMQRTDAVKASCVLLGRAAFYASSTKERNHECALRHEERWRSLLRVTRQRDSDRSGEFEAR